jgi:hypothetical protein
LSAISRYEREGKMPTTYDIAGDVYHLTLDDAITDAQHVAVKRALEGLQRKGQVIGFCTRSRRGDDGREERCHHWMLLKGAQAYLDELRRDVEWCEKNRINPSWARRVQERFLRKAQSIGMRLD